LCKRKPKVDPMPRVPRLWLAGTGVAIATFSYVLVLEAHVSSTMPTGRGIDPSTVNRELKGDQLPLVPPPRGENQAPQTKPMPEGCEPSFSTIRNPQRKDIAGRCLV
jgi:hypothetical protein